MSFLDKKSSGRVTKVDTQELLNMRGSAGEAALQDLADSIILPSEKSEIINDLLAFTYLFFGVQKIGKTSFTMEFSPDTCHIMYEPSTEDYSVYKVDPPSWEWFKAFVLKNKQLKEAGTPKYKMFSVDVVDACYMQCFASVCKRVGVDYPPEDRGKTWNKISEEFTFWMYELAKCGGVIFVSHMTEKQIEKMDGSKYDIITASCKKQCYLILSKFCSMTGFYYVDNHNERQLGIQANFQYEAGNRLQNHFHWKGTHEDVDIIPMGKNSKEAFLNFKLAFDNLLPKPIEEPELDSNGENGEKKKPGFRFSKKS